MAPDHHRDQPHGPRLRLRPRRLTPADKAATDPAGYAAQERFAALSDNSSLRTADTTHAGLVDAEQGASISARAITDVVRSLRTASPLTKP